MPPASPGSFSLLPSARSLRGLKRSPAPPPARRRAFLSDGEECPAMSVQSSGHLPTVPADQRTVARLPLLFAIRCPHGPASSVRRLWHQADQRARAVLLTRREQRWPLRSRSTHPNIRDD